jgi:phosphoribosylaminoimidazolecarboxamide formyltransferase/IMP cyclohydrolase
MIEIKRALISVYDKAGLLELAKVLLSKNVEIISSGGTANYLQSNGINVVSVDSVTEFPEMLSGRVKTLHPKIHGGILYLRNDQEHQATVKEHGIKSIDLVVVNLYPFEETISKPGVKLEEAIEQIDIGGPSLLRSASKNHQSVAVLSSPSQYQAFINNFEANTLAAKQLRELAIAAFEKTAQYDAAISSYLSAQLAESEKLPEAEKEQTITLVPKQKLRYAENPHQEGFLFTLKTSDSWKGLDTIQQLSGKELSYNNWLDIDSAWSLISEFETDFPACAIIKHNSPCGVALGETVLDAYEHALECDPISAFGGIVAFNKEVDKDTAETINQMFLEVIVAPAFSEQALTVLKQKKNLRLIQASLLPQETKYPLYRTILGNGILRQEFDSKLLNKEEMKVVTEAQPSQEEWLGLLFAFRIAKHVRSNAIVLVNGSRTVGICGGQTNRVSSVQIAIQQASDLATGSILASDGFFPFADNVELAAQGRIKAIIQPGGSIRDDEVIEAANKYKIPMVFTGMRHFKH